MFEKNNYKLTLIRVIDGDTIEAHIDVGLNIIVHNQRFRLAGINAYEITEPKGPEAKARLEKLLSLVFVYPNTFWANTIKDKKDKYGRVLLSIPFDISKTINDVLVEEGLAVRYMV